MQHGCISQLPLGKEIFMNTTGMRVRVTPYLADCSGLALSADTRTYIRGQTTNYACVMIQRHAHAGRFVRLGCQAPFFISSTSLVCLA